MSYFRDREKLTEHSLDFPECVFDVLPFVVETAPMCCIIPESRYGFESLCLKLRYEASSRVFELDNDRIQGVLWSDFDTGGACSRFQSFFESST
ncbi:hypothetical protein WK55_09585 [Burkholderia ubonensis]|nr:hypothetical protein WK55_09585 [Burkholderia ubonensis]